MDSFYFALSLTRFFLLAIVLEWRPLAGED
jgi:hypothetical protein